jgi:hypothetical protein
MDVLEDLDDVRDCTFAKATARIVKSFDEENSSILKNKEDV